MPLYTVSVNGSMTVVRARTPETAKRYAIDQYVIASVHPTTDDELAHFTGMGGRVMETPSVRRGKSHT